MVAAICELRIDLLTTGRKNGITGNDQLMSQRLWMLHAVHTLGLKHFSDPLGIEQQENLV